MPLMNGAIEQVGEKRRETRYPVIKRAQIVFQNSVIDCTVLDVSPNGARVHTDAVGIIPEQVVFQFKGGAAFFARRRWSRGMEASFIFDRPVPLGENAALVALSAFEALLAKGVAESVRLLRAERFLDDPMLGEVAEEAEAACRRYESTLRLRLNLKS